MHKLVSGLALCASLAACVTTYEAPRRSYYAPPPPPAAPPPVQEGYYPPPPPPAAAPVEPEPGTIGLNKTTGGALVGAGAGGLIGSQFGHGKGKTVATLMGVLAGGLIGSQIGASLDRADQAALHQTTQNALETAPAGQPLPWRNPDSGNYGNVVPAAVYQTSDGRYCREFQQTIVVGGREEQGHGTACRQPDGSWKIVQ